MFNLSGGLIRLDVVVTDQTGKPVTGLGVHDFTVLDNDQPRNILSFGAYDEISVTPGPPVELIIVLDLVDIGGPLGSLARGPVPAGAGCVPSVQM